MHFKTQFAPRATRSALNIPRLFALVVYRWNDLYRPMNRVVLVSYSTTQLLIMLYCKGCFNSLFPCCDFFKLFFHCSLLIHINNYQRHALLTFLNFHLNMHDLAIIINKYDYNFMILYVWMLSPSGFTINTIETNFEASSAIFFSLKNFY
jgi:hypothetical protein